MKTTVIKSLAFAVVILFATATNAQTLDSKTSTGTKATTAPKGPTAAQTAKADKITGKLNDLLKLSADQTAKAKAINLDAIVKEDQMRKDANGDKKKLADLEKTITANREAKLKTILTPAQYTTMMQAVENSNKPK